MVLIIFGKVIFQLFLPLPRPFLAPKFFPLKLRSTSWEVLTLHSIPFKLGNVYLMPIDEGSNFKNWAFVSREIRYLLFPLFVIRCLCLYLLSFPLSIYVISLSLRVSILYLYVTCYIEGPRNDEMVFWSDQK